MSGFELAGLCFFVGVTALVVVVLIGLHVVKRYPNAADPARNARRFTVPTVTLALVGIAAIIFSFGAGLTALVTGLTALVMSIT